jgi:dTDP-4-dehydrorhamnose 3,5-epimerase-like enzyme
LSKDTDIDDVREIEFLEIYDAKTSIRVLQGLDLKRLFITSPLNSQTRGSHAHKKCSQILYVLDGEVEINLSDGRNQNRFLLKNNLQSILIPPGIWSTQNYSQYSRLLVLCDQLYDENDYIRSWNDFLEFKNVKNES